MKQLLVHQDEQLRLMGTTHFHPWFYFEKSVKTSPFLFLPSALFAGVQVIWTQNLPASGSGHLNPAEALLKSLHGDGG